MDTLEDMPRNPTPSTLKRINMRRFLEELRRRGPSTRADLTRSIGVTPPTSSSIIADLMEAGYLEEAKFAISGKGRPGKFFRLATEHSSILAATIDVERCSVACAGLDGALRLDTLQTMETPRQYHALIEGLCGMAQSAMKAAGGKWLGLGVTVPGLVQERDGAVEFSPNLHMLDGAHLAADLSSRLGIHVVCTQEDHALCVAEQFASDQSGMNNFVVIDFGAGVGMGVVSGGRYLTGSHGFAGEVGHVTVAPNGSMCGCGNRGCLETVVSDTAMLARLRQRIDTPVAVEDIPRLVTQDEMDDWIGYAAIGIAAVVNVLNPSRIFLHGRLLSHNSAMLAALNDAVRSRALRPSMQGVSIEMARGDKLSGAAHSLLDDLFAAVGPTLA